MVIPEVPPGSTEPVPPEMSGLGFWGPVWAGECVHAW